MNRWICAFCAVMAAFSAAGAQQWELTDPYPTNDNLVDVSFVDVTHLCAVGQSGTIVYSGDGGSNWIKAASSTRRNLNALYFLDGQHGWAVGDSGTAVWTVNGGTTWNTGQCPTNNTLEDVMFADALHGWAVGNPYYGAHQPGVVMYTEDGGHSWAEQYQSNHIEFYSVFCRAPGSVWVVGDSATIIRSTDRGVSWSSSRVNEESRLTDIFFLTDSTGWTSSYYHLLYTSDG
jgi:photosystem II stability/assembly factor-like uncharacterized protein